MRQAGPANRPVRLPRTGEQRQNMPRSLQWEPGHVFFRRVVRSAFRTRLPRRGRRPRLILRPGRSGSGRDCRERIRRPDRIFTGRCIRHFLHGLRFRSIRKDHGRIFTAAHRRPDDDADDGYSRQSSSNPIQHLLPGCFPPFQEERFPPFPKFRRPASPHRRRDISTNRIPYLPKGCCGRCMRAAAR